MIEKIKVYEETPSGYKHPENIVQDKINEIIDIINAITIDVDGTKCIDGSKAPADPYAEQCKWIGKLCKFWDYDDEEKWFSMLEYIDKNSPYPYCASGDWWYKHCEPVKPDDDIIYKGGDNE